MNSNTSRDSSFSVGVDRCSSYRSQYPRRQLSARWSCPWALFLIVASLLAQFASAQTPEFFFRVGTMDDIVEAVPGTNVLLEQTPNPDIWVSSDVDGLTAFRRVQPAFPVLVTLGETSYAGGISLGQRMFEDMPAIPLGYDSFYYTRVYNQPRAIPVLVTTEADVTASPHHNRWQFAPFIDPAVRLSFQAYVAMLLTASEIERYAAYYGVILPQPGEGDYRLGVVIRVGGAVDLASDSLALEVDCRGHQFSSAPSVSAFRVSSAAPPNLPYSFNGVVGRWDTIVGRAHIVLGGKLERGDNLILLHTGPQATGRIQGSTPPLEMSIPVLLSDCIPAKPSPPPGWSCTPTVPSSDCPTSSLGGGCGTKTISVNDVRCGPAGSSHSSGNRSHWGGSISIPATIGGVATTLEGSYTWEFESSTTYTYGAGAGGCGQCMQDFRHFLSCKTKYRMQRSRYRPRRVALELAWEEIPCAFSYEQTSECTDAVGPSTVACDRSCP
jgi:hypothetical protein